MIRSFVKRHKEASIIVLVICALILSYPLWPGAVRCEIVRYKLAAYLQFQEMIHSEEDKDYMGADINGRQTLCYFENKTTLNTLKIMVLSSRIEDATGHQLSTWPTPMYYVGKVDIGGYGTLVYKELFSFYLLYLSSHNSTKLIDYVDQIMQKGEMDGMG